MLYPGRPNGGADRGAGAMSENRTARNEAWITSRVLHVAVLAGVVAVIGRPREAPEGPVGVSTRDTGHTIEVVMLDAPAITTS